MHMKRKLSPIEYHTPKGTIRMSKGSFSGRPETEREIRQRKWFARHAQTLRLAPNEREFHGARSFSFSIIDRASGSEIGWCARGHRRITDDRRGQYIFSYGLRHLEEHEEREYFKRGNFEGYKRQFTRMIANEAEVGKRENNYITHFSEPHYFDYTQRIDTAISLLRNGYELAPFSLTEIERIPGFQKSESIARSLEECLKRHPNQPNLGRILLFAKKYKPKSN